MILLMNSRRPSFITLRFFIERAKSRDVKGVLREGLHAECERIGL